LRDPSVPQDVIALQTELLQCRASLYDPDTKLPTLPVVMDRVRKLLDEGDAVEVYLVRIEQEHTLEGIVGWERYDLLLRRLAETLRSAVDGAAGRRVVLCQESVRGDMFLLFSADRYESARIHGALIEGVPLSEEDGGGWFPVRIGQGRIERIPKLRVERCIYGGILEARRDFIRRGEALDEARTAELRRIIRDRAISSLFQPIVEVPGHKIIGYEALSRGPLGSYLESAENLFGFSERAGLVAEVELLCLERALVCARRLPENAVLFINLSIRGLEYLEGQSGGLARMVAQASWSPQSFVLEITERTYSENPKRMQSQVRALRRQGFRLAIDDMGTGYSALHVLADLEPDFIKLDRTLVRDLAHEPIKRNLVSAITNFAESSRSVIIAEGVETQDEVQVLQDLGITLAQGFFFGQPQGAGEQSSQSR
jgi:EAL domain-containing protein (putative c-di-GMP-specific phosphodiesterase class I)